MGTTENSKPRNLNLYLGGLGLTAGTYYVYHLLTSCIFPSFRGGV
jgi:hypothetical protein